MVQRYKIFVSHAGEDRGAAGLLGTCIEQAGGEAALDTFFLSAGLPLFDKIEHELTTSQEFVIFLSPAFISKAWAGAEFGLAKSMAKRTGMRIIVLLYQFPQDDLRRRDDWRSLIGDSKFVDFNDVLTYWDELKGRIDGYNESLAKWTEDEKTETDQLRRLKQIAAILASTQAHR